MNPHFNFSLNTITPRCFRSCSRRIHGLENARLKSYSHHVLAMERWYIWIDHMSVIFHEYCRVTKCGNGMVQYKRYLNFGPLKYTSILYFSNHFIYWVFNLNLKNSNISNNFQILFSIHSFSESVAVFKTLQMVWTNSSLHPNV